MPVVALVVLVTVAARIQSPLVPCRCSTRKVVSLVELSTHPTVMLLVEAASAVRLMGEEGALGGVVTETGPAAAELTIPPLLVALTRY